MKWLIPVDGSELSLEAVAYALRLARAGLRYELVLVNVQEPSTVYEMVTLPDSAALYDLAVAAGHDMLKPALDLVAQADVPYSVEVRVGDVLPMLLEVLEETGCEGVIMGSHGRGLIRRTLLGSVSHQMLQQSPVPVTFVKHVDSEPAATEASADADDTPEADPPSAAR
ncbi:MAG: universal stress protein [Pseudomonadota bacterium]|jgi:nucleotide-binding universal stress UspA family protein